jgi:hypothetical protein
MENSSNRNVGFKQPIYQSQHLANGFIYGFLNLDPEALTGTILVDDATEIPVTMSLQVREKTIEKGIRITSKLFCSTYPQTNDRGNLSLQISAIHYPQELNIDLVDRFRIRGIIESCDCDWILVKIRPRTSSQKTIAIENRPIIEASPGQLWEFYCYRSIDRLILDAAERV